MTNDTEPAVHEAALEALARPALERARMSL